MDTFSSRICNVRICSRICNKRFNVGDYKKAVMGLLFCSLFVFREIYVLVTLRVCEFDENQLYLTNFLLYKRMIPYDSVIYIQKKKCDGVPIVYLSYGFFFIKYKINCRTRVKIINIQNVDYWKQFKEIARNKDIQVLEPKSKTI